MTDEMNMNDNGATKPQEEISVEAAFQQLQALLQNMEKDDTTLEDSFRSYEEGMKLIRICNDRIDRVEKKVQMMNSDGTTQDFE
ncbi:Exodeoxyribonuclease VII small subunit [Lachnospiraceae bacterium NK3A20]|nr:Exodeoxyribonuclease VII small subunit [Lachnospiraceae bacterium NK3A20]